MFEQLHIYPKLQAQQYQLNKSLQKTQLQMQKVHLKYPNLLVVRLI